MDVEDYNQYLPRWKKAHQSESGIPYFDLSDALTLHVPSAAEITIYRRTPLSGAYIAIQVDHRDQELSADQLSQVREAVLAEAEAHEYFRRELKKFPDLSAFLGIDTCATEQSRPLGRGTAGES